MPRQDRAGALPPETARSARCNEPETTPPLDSTTFATEPQAISLGTVSPGQHQFGVSFLNDAWGGTSDTDRNLYVTGASYNGQTLPGATATLYSAGTDTFSFTIGQTVTSTAVVNVSEDAYQGDAQFTVAVDGNQIGGVYTARGSHAAGQSQAITLSGLAENFSPHDIAVTFLNRQVGRHAPD